MDSPGTVLVTASLPERLLPTVQAWGWTVREIGSLPVAEDAAATRAILDQDASITAVLVDHYDLDGAWERGLRTPGRLVIVLDDLADRPHDCDVLISPSPGGAEEPLPSPDAGRPTTFRGPRYAPLDPAYDEIRPRTRTGAVDHLLVFLGGATDGSDLLPLIDALAGSDVGIDQTTIVLGHAFTNRDQVHSRVATLPRVRVIDSVASMIPVLLTADLAIGAPGGAQWERCAAGLPTLTALTHPNQRHDCLAFESAGATRHLGDLQDMTMPRWQEALLHATGDPASLAAMSTRAAELVARREEAWSTARDNLRSMLSAAPGGQS
jgi:UDP-2,4-diacetamido-2,4,6-trideoxy-beta-L-altropyranose hydrolase